MWYRTRWEIRKYRRQNNNWQPFYALLFTQTIFTSCLSWLVVCRMLFIYCVSARARSQTKKISMNPLQTERNSSWIRFDFFNSFGISETDELIEKISDKLWRNYDQSCLFVIRDVRLRVNQSPDKQKLRNLFTTSRTFVWTKFKCQTQNWKEKHTSKVAQYITMIYVLSKCPHEVMFCQFHLKQQNFFAKYLHKTAAAKQLRECSFCPFVVCYFSLCGIAHSHL